LKDDSSFCDFVIGIYQISQTCGFCGWVLTCPSLCGCNEHE
jgi:hypothetical protein